MRIAGATVGSESPIKVGAACRALAQVGFPDVPIEKIATHSGVPEQPMSEEETRAGARTRARQAYEHAGKTKIGIGIESGLWPLENGWYDIAWITIHTDNGRFEAQSAAFPIPTWAVDRCTPEHDLGAVVKKLSGGDAKDPHWYFSKGIIIRHDLICDALQCALIRMVSDRYWNPSV